MDGYIDTSTGGVTELRIHGVAATPPEEMLENPHVNRVSGDSTAGFYRRLWVNGLPTGVPYADEVGRRRREAYSWGGLTSGAGSRAWWMLLLPFMLANVAFWMFPAATLPDEKPWLSRIRDLASAAQRLFSLSLTLALTLSAVDVATDLVGWQCGSSRDCLAGHWFLDFLNLSFFAQPSRRLAIATMVPVLVVALLWWLGHASWNAYELLKPPAQASAARGHADGSHRDLQGATRVPVPPIGRRRMWNGARPVGRLRWMHVCAASATTGLFLVAPLASTGRWAAVFAVLLVMFCVLLVWPAAALILPEPWRRKAPGEDGRQFRDYLWPWLPRVSLALVGVSMILALAVPGAGPAVATGSLPWLTGFLGWMLLVQMGLLAFIFAVVAVAAIASRLARGEEDSLPGRALGGLGGPALLVLSWALTASLAAGLVLRWAGALATPAPAGMPAEQPKMMLVPVPYYLAAAGAISAVAVTVAAVAVLALTAIWRRAASSARQRVAQTYPNEDLADLKTASAQIRARARAIGRSWTRASLTDHAPLLLAITACSLAAAAVASVAGYGATTVMDGSAVHGMWLWQHASWLATAGSWATGVFVITLIGMGRRAYSNPATRRTVGMLWDFGTFWPRATHPLAPPCYCERTLPELINRVAWLAPAEKDLVVLSTHSQGSVIAAALILQLDKAQRKRTAFLTYGSPLQRLYSRFFPAYFGPEVLSRIGDEMAGSADPDQAAARGRWPWRNLYRASDPVGGPIFRAWPADEANYEPAAIAAVAAGGPPGGDSNDVDRQLLDPVFHRPPGDFAEPPIRGHSNYFADPYFQQCVKEVTELAQRPASQEPGQTETAGVPAS